MVEPKKNERENLDSLLEKFGDWQDDEESTWYNDRVIQSYISSDEVDAHGDMMVQSKFAEILPFLTKYGYYEWGHTGFSIGKILAWRFSKDPKDGKIKPEIKVGIHSTDHSNLPQHDQEVWPTIKRYGERGTSSINGYGNLMEMVRDGFQNVEKVHDFGVYAVGWVGDDPANSGATVSWVNNKAKVKSQNFHENFILNKKYLQSNNETKRNIDTAAQGGSNTSSNPKKEREDSEMTEEMQKAIDKLTKSVSSIQSDLDAMRKEKADLEKADTEERIAELEKALKGKQAEIEKMKSDLEKGTDGDPEDEEEEDEGKSKEDEPVTDDEIADVEAKVDTLADAVVALEPGTQEAVEQAVEIATEVKDESENLEMMKRKKAVTSEQKQKIAELQKSLKSHKASLLQKMSKPLTKSRQAPSARKLAKHKDNVEDLWDSAEKDFSSGNGKTWWAKNGFIRDR